MSGPTVLRSQKTWPERGAFDGAALAEVDPLDVGREPDAGKQQIDALGDLARRGGRLGAFFGERLDDGLAAIVDDRR